MDGTNPGGASEALWIVLTPSADDAAWRTAIREGAEAAGMTLRDADTEVPASTDDSARIVWLTSDCAVPESLGRRPTSVLIPRPETAPEAITAKLGIFPPTSVTHASLLIARAAAQDPRRTRIISASDISASSRGQLTLAEGLTVVAPTPEPVEAVRPAVRRALEAFSSGAPSFGQEIVWSERIFRYDQKAARAARHIGDLDITGRPRILVYGPYLALTPGRWGAKIRFLVNAPAAGKDFRFDWGSPNEFASVTVTPPHAGVYEIDLEHQWHAVELSEIRLWLMEGAFDGILHFLGASVTFLGRPLANAA